MGEWKGTPGEWHYDTDANGAFWIVGDKSTWTPRIAKVPNYSDMPNEANALAISLVPDMIEALRDISKLVGPLNSRVYAYDREMKAINAILSKLDADK